MNPTLAGSRRGTRRSACGRDGGAGAPAGVLALVLVLAGLSLFAPGCNIVGPAAYFIVGPDKVKPVYELDEKKTAVIFIDDRANRIPSRAAREAIGAAAEERMLEEKVVAEMVKSRAIQAVVARERFGKPIGIADVGKAVSADIVIYAWVDAFSLTSDGQTYLPNAVLRIKIIDVATKARLYPPADGGEQWYQLAISLPQQQGFVPKTPAERAKAEQDFSRWVGVAIAQMFYEHVPTKPASRIEEGPS